MNRTPLTQVRGCVGKPVGGWALSVFTTLFIASACTPKKPVDVTPPSAWRSPDVPAALATAPERARYEEGWTRVRRGDVAGGERVFSDIVRRTPEFYPASASLGELRLHRQQYAAAAASFDRALAVNPAYLPALAGAADARLGAGDDPGALRALEALASADASRGDTTARILVVKLRIAQAELALAERAKSDGRMVEAAVHVERALDATPENAAVLRFSAALELAAGHLDVAEARARQAVGIDAEDAAAHAALGDVLEAQGRLTEAVRAYTRALALDPRPSWRERLGALSASAEMTSLPPQYRAITQAAAVTRADVAALLGVRLASPLSHAPDRNQTVVTDIRGHWAANWILPVIRAGWVEALPNHTFQPGGTVRRADLAAIVAAVLTDLAAGRPRDVARWRSARPVYADVTRDHAAYGVAAMATASGVMTAENGRFAPARVVSGAELAATITRLEQLGEPAPR